MVHLSYALGANYMMKGFFDPTKKDLHWHALDVLIFQPFEPLIDNTLFGRGLPQKGKRNRKVLLIKSTDYTTKRDKELVRIREMNNTNTEFFAFHERLLWDTVAM